MKTAIFFLVAFSMLGTLGARELSLDRNLGQTKKVKYELGVSKFDFSTQDRIMPGVTLLINDSLPKRSSVEFTLARTISAYDGSEIFTRLTPRETAVYAILSYRF